MINPLRSDVVLDMGTEKTRIALRGRGILMEEPSAVAFRSGEQAIAAGEEAVTLAGKNPAGVQLVWPIRGGAVSDVAAAGEMVRLMMRKARSGWPRLWRLALILTPACLSEVEKRAAEQAVKLAGAAEVWLEDAGWAAALGCGLPLDAPRGSMVVDIGAGTTTAAVYSMQGQVACQCCVTGADSWDQAMIGYIRREHQVVVNEETAREIKSLLADVYEPCYEDTHPVRGRDIASGLPVTLDIGATEICQALEGCMEALLETVSAALAQTPPELAADVLKNGLTLCGGGSLLKGLPQRMEQALHIPVSRAQQPGQAAVLGGETLLERGIAYLHKRAGIQPGRRIYHA